MNIPTVKLIALPESTASGIYGLYDVLSYYAQAWGELTGNVNVSPRFDVKIIAEEKTLFKCTGNIPIEPHESFNEVTQADVVIITDLMLPSGIDPRNYWHTAVNWLKQMYQKDSIICSICSGSVLLADTGLLDNHTATTHWGFVNFFADYYPNIKLKADRIIAFAGEDQRIITTGGMASWEDLALYLIAKFHGGQDATHAAKVYLFGDRSEGQLLYAAMNKPRRHQDSIINEVQIWITDNYKLQNIVTKATEKSGLHERTFKRRFKAATGYTPVDYIQTLRIEEAKEILESTSLSIEEVALAIGYEDLSFFRSLFKRKTGVTPSRYRQRFNKISQMVT